MKKILLSVFGLVLLSSASIVAAIPENASYLKSAKDGWACKAGYVRHQNYCIIKPDYSKVTLDGWTCKDSWAYEVKKVGTLCVPPKSYPMQYNVCDRDYMKSGNKCVFKGDYSKYENNTSNIPPNAYASGSGWKCKEGFYISLIDANRCVEIIIPENAFATSTRTSGWQCKSGFEPVGRACVKVDQSSKIPPKTNVSGSGFPNCYGDDWSDCIQRYDYPSGDWYFGQWQNNQAYGRGTYRWKTGEAYGGDFENNQFNGRGRYCASETNCINGVWKNGEILYEHTITVTGFMQATERCYRNKYKLDEDNEILRETYCGPREDQPFTLDQLKLIASIKEPEVKECFGFDKDLYKSYLDPKLFNNCIANWKFSLDDSNWPGATYTGEWKEGKPDGNGVAVYQEESGYAGTKYVGEFKDGIAHGYGVMTTKGGGSYRGEWLFDKANGQGILTQENGSVYVGEFKDDMPNGQGTMTESNGQKGKGQFINGFMVNGSINYVSGDNFEGQLENDQIKEGIYTFAESGNIYEGKFVKDGILIEGSVIFAEDGSIFEGIWNEDGMLLEGKKTLENGSTQEGKFNDQGDLIDGIAMSADGSIIEVGENSKPNTQIAENNVADDEIMPAASGSGFAVTSDGYVVTNYHVIEGCNSVEVYENNQPIAAVVVNFDLNNDIALLKANFKPNHYFPLRSKNPNLLMDIYAAGYPFGYDISTPVKVTQGIVSSLSGVGNNYSNIQIDAAIQPGNSGGPIIDKKGNVVAVAVATLDLEEVYEAYGVIPEGTNFGIKSNVVINFLESNNVQTSEPNTRNVSTESLGRMISDGTYYISCLMTMAQINNLRERKVMFSDLK